jgi:hypothetical protein
MKSDYEAKMKIDVFFYSHKFVELFRAVKSHDVNAIKVLNDFAVGMIQRGAHHIAADGDFHFALGVLNQNRAVE